jgi:hypothetical protein
MFNKTSAWLVVWVVAWFMSVGGEYWDGDLLASDTVRGGADKSLARPWRKQATATKLGFIQHIPHEAKKNQKVVRPIRSPRQQWPRRAKNGELSNVFSVQGTGGSPTGPDPQNRVSDQETWSTGTPFSSGLQVPGENAMKINPSKSKVFCFTRTRVKDPLSYSLTDTVIPEASSCKYLGINLRSDLNWADQVNYTVKKAWKALRFTMRILNKGNSNTKI